MVDKTENQKLVLKYYKAEEITSIKELGNRLIVNLNAKSDENKAIALKKELEQQNPCLLSTSDAADA